MGTKRNLTARDALRLVGMQMSALSHGITVQWSGMKRMFVSLLGLVVIGGLVYALAIRPWFLRWGATSAELKQSLPGDEIVDRPMSGCTRAITINAPPEKVWPWIAQIGQGRAGFYSYTWLENLIGCQIVNADRIHPEWQDPKPGDVVRMHPKAPPIPVSFVHPGYALVLGAQSGPATPGFPSISWAFIVESAGAGRTRLLLRTRSSFQPTAGQYLTNKYILEPIQFIMERRMMLGIKERAERQ